FRAVLPRRPPGQTLFPYTTLFRSKTLGGRFDLEDKKTRITELEQKMTSPSIWDDQEEAQQVIEEVNWLKGKVNQYEEIESQQEDIETMYELAKEESEEELITEMNNDIEKLQIKVRKFELDMLLSEPYDKNNAILELHPGAGGTESQD